MCWIRVNPWKNKRVPTVWQFLEKYYTRVFTYYYSKYKIHLI